MLTKVLIYVSYTLEFLGLVVGFSMYSRLPVAWRFVHAAVCIAFLVEMTATVFIKNFSGDRNTQWLYNLYLLADGPLLAAAATLLLRHRIATMAGMAGIVLCYGVWILQALQQPLTRFYTTAFLAQCILLTTLYLALPFRGALSDKVKIGRSEVFLCVANVLYSGCNIPRFALFHYLTESDNWRYFVYVFPITNILSVLRYSLILAGLLSLPRRANAQTV